VRLNGHVRVQRIDEAAHFVVGDSAQRLPLGSIEGGSREDRRRNGQTVRGEIFEETQRQRKRRDGSGSGGAERLFNPPGLVPDRLQCIGYDRAAAVRPGARDEVDKLPPANRRIVTVFGRLVQNGQQTIVKAHLPGCSFGRTLLSLYARIYNALSGQLLTIP
jgi:hypothetical protein